MKKVFAWLAGAAGFALLIIALLYPWFSQLML